MHARRFGFDASLPPAFKFDPTNENIVAHYLLPRAVNLPNPHAHAVIDDDTCSCQPWELMRHHGHADSDHTFFFGPARPPGKKAGLTNHVVPAGEYGVDGKWRGQKGEEEDLVLVRGGAGGAQIDLKYKRYNLTYYRNGQEGSTEWAMHEYHITKPSLLPGAVLSRVRITDAAKKERQKQQKKAAAANQQVVPCQEQQGPSNYLVDGHAAGNAVASSDGAGTSSGAQSEVVHQGDNNGVVMGETPGYYTDLLNNAGEDDGYYVDNSNDYLDEEDINDYLDEDINNYLNQGDSSDYFTFVDYSNFDHRDGGNGG